MSESRSGKIAVVFGGTGGFGSEICTRFAANGHRVVVVGTSSEAAEKFAHSLGSEGDGESGHIGLACDVRDPGQVAKAFDIAERRLSIADILVNSSCIREIQISWP